MWFSLFHYCNPLSPVIIPPPFSLLLLLNHQLLSLDLFIFPPTETQFLLWFGLCFHRSDSTRPSLFTDPCPFPSTHLCCEPPFVQVPSFSSYFLTNRDPMQESTIRFIFSVHSFLSRWMQLCCTFIFYLLLPFPLHFYSGRMTCLVSDANSPSSILLKVTPVSNKMCDALMDGSTVAIRELTLLV